MPMDFVQFLLPIFYVFWGAGLENRGGLKSVVWGVEGEVMGRMGEVKYKRK